MSQPLARTAIGAEPTLEGGVSDRGPGTSQPVRAEHCAATAFDGIVCFGGVDWWYHNRGHYDIQIMRELSKRVPVLYINSIGMKAPNPLDGALFARRVARKLRSLRRGLREPTPGFYVYSPPTLPGTGVSSSIVTLILAHQVKRAARRCGISRPLLWVACPPAAYVVDRIDCSGIVYQRTDRMELFHQVNYQYIAQLDRQLKKRADLVVFCAHELYETEGPHCRRAALVDHGVDFERFAAAGDAFDRQGAQPADLADIPVPRAGFVGGMDPHTFDSRLFLDVAARLPHVQFVLVGGSSLPKGWCDLPNVHLLGQRPYEQVAAYMAACQVLIMPWNQNEWIEACNPVKLKEYLATGRPVVSTPFRELELYREHIAIARDPDEFARLIEHGLQTPGDPARRRSRVRAHGWAVKADAVWSML